MSTKGTAVQRLITQALKAPGPLIATRVWARLWGQCETKFRSTGLVEHVGVA